MALGIGVAVGFLKKVYTSVQPVVDAVTAAVNAFYTTYIARVTTDSGSVRSETNTKTIYRWFVENDLVDYIKFLWCAEAGIKVANPSDTLKRLSKGYSLDATPNDWTQGTESSQPYLSGNIAPTEKYAAKNVSGAARYGNFTAVTFTAGQAWTATFVGQWDGSNNAEVAFLGKANDTASLITLRDSSVDRFRIINESAASVAGAETINHLVGKNIIVSFVATGAGSLKIYVNGTLFETLTVATDISLSTFLRGFNTASRNFFGKCHHIDITQYDFTSLISSYHTLLRTMYPEVETVQIGSQHWATSNYDAVVTPMGTEIQEVTLAVNTEKITDAANREFSSDTGFWTKDGLTTINDGGSGVCNIITDGAGTFSGIRKTLLTANKWYKFTYTIVANRANTLELRTGNAFVDLISTVGTHSIYFKSDGLYFRIGRKDVVFADIDIDNISLEEVGWTGLDEIATNVGQSSAAAWCYYNSDAATGAIYSKLYNWWAVKQLQDDIDAWNTANPTNLWGYHVPTEVELTTLSAQGGNALKIAGTTFWNTTGGTNTTGFTALGAGKRSETDGSFSDTKNITLIGCTTTTKALQINHNNDTASIITIDAKTGRSIRLLKD